VARFKKGSPPLKDEWEEMKEEALDTYLLKKSK
jgi:hypothetical protein